MLNEVNLKPNFLQGLSAKGGVIKVGKLNSKFRRYEQDHDENKIQEKVQNDNNESINISQNKDKKYRNTFQAKHNEMFNRDNSIESDISNYNFTKNGFVTKNRLRDPSLSKFYL